MNYSESIKIPSNKTMIILMLIGALGFVIVGMWLLNDSERFVNTIFRSIVIIKIAGGLGIAFFGTIVFSIMGKLFSKSWGITIDKTGIYDNSSGVSAGLIIWEDIVSYSIQGVASESFLFIYVKNPEFYIARKKNIISKMAMKVNYKLYKTPLQIPSRTIKIKLSDLKKHIDHYYDAYHSNNSL